MAPCHPAPLGVWILWHYFLKNKTKKAQKSLDFKDKEGKINMSFREITISYKAGWENSVNNPWWSVKSPWWIQMGDEAVCLRTYIIKLWRIAPVIHLNNCLTKTHTLSHTGWEGKKGGAVKKKREREGKGEAKGGDHKSNFNWSVGYCFTNLLAQQCCEFNHIAVLKT